MPLSRVLLRGGCLLPRHLLRATHQYTIDGKPESSMRMLARQLPRFMGRLIVFSGVAVGVSYGFGVLALSYHLERLSPTPPSLSWKARSHLHEAYLHDALVPDLPRSQFALHQALALAEKECGLRSPEALHIRTLLADLSARSGRWDILPILLADFLPALQADPARVDDAVSLIARLADAYIRLGREEDAAPLVEWALSHADPIASPRPQPDGARCLLLAAKLAGRQGRTEEALWITEQVHRIGEREGRSSRKIIHRGGVGEVFGSWWRRMNKLPGEAAEPTHRDPWACIDARALMTSGALSERVGGSSEKVDTLWEAALTISEKGAGMSECDQCYAELTLKLGSLSETSGDLDGARALFLQAMERAKDARALYLYAESARACTRINQEMREHMSVTAPEKTFPGPSVDDPLPGRTSPFKDDSIQQTSPQ